MMILFYVSGERGWECTKLEPREVVPNTWSDVISPGPSASLSLTGTKPRVPWLLRMAVGKRKGGHYMRHHLAY